MEMGQRMMRCFLDNHGFCIPAIETKGLRMKQAGLASSNRKVAIEPGGVILQDFSTKVIFQEFSSQVRTYSPETIKEGYSLHQNNH